MTLDNARHVLALKALEEADPSGLVIPWERRQEATQEATQPDQKVALHPRALALTRPQRLEAACAAIAASPQRVRPRRWVWIIASIAFALGLAAHVLGDDHSINLLSMPMLGLLLWNLLVYLLLLVSALRREPQSAHRPSTWLGQWAMRLAGAPADVLEPVTASSPSVSSERASTSAADQVQLHVPLARSRFWDLWLRVVKKQAYYISEGLFHLGAFALAAGMIVGMYVRGLAFEYTAAWESTFLKPAQVSSLLKAALGPAAAVLGQSIPDADGMATLNIHHQEGLRHTAPQQLEKAGRWMNYYALSVLMVILIPRALLAGAAWWGGRRLQQKAPFEPELESWEATVRRAAKGGQVIRIFSFSHELVPRRRDEARTLLHQIWPAANHVDFQPSIAYGEEDQALAQLDELPAHVGLLMNFSATPEDEVQGAIVRILNSRTQSGPDGERNLAIILDAQSFYDRFASLPEGQRRILERMAAWERMLESIMPAAHSVHGSFHLWRRV